MFVYFTYFQKSFTEHGGLFKDNEKVLQIEPGEIVRIVTQKNIYKVKSVILALGPWAPPFLKKLDLHLPLEVNEYLLYTC